MGKARWSARRVALVGMVAAVGLWAQVPAQGVTVRVSGSAGAGNGAEDWIVLFDDGVGDVEGLARQEARRQGAKLREVFDGSVKGFTATFTARKPGHEGTVWDARVTWIEREQEYTLVGVQAEAPTGLDRIDQRALPLDSKYAYQGAGAGVTAYVLDTGVMGTHAEFGFPSRVQPGFDATRSTSLAKILSGRKKARPANQDCNGHGTHVAGTIGGAVHGVAKEVTIVPVRVLSCSGRGSTSTIIKGIEWMVAEVERSGGPAVANMSLGGGASVALDQAVRNAVSRGISFAVAAGNGAADACAASPSGVTEAMTVAASDPTTDIRPLWSNHGPCVDWFAPGVAITSAGTRTSTATAVYSGTSMAAPHTAGVAALHLSANPSARPSEIEEAIRAAATPGVITGDSRSPNLLLFTNL